MSVEPQVIILNGTSSAGKSTIAGALQNTLDWPALHIEYDTLVKMLPDAHFKTQPLEAYYQRLEKFYFAVNRSTLEYLEAGYGLIIDTVMGHWSVYRQWVELYNNALLVAVHCPLEVLEDREVARGNRKIGLARGQHQWVHRHGFYDLELDSHQLDADTCAQKIKAALTKTTSPTAFEQLKARFDNGLITSRYLWET